MSPALANDQVDCRKLRILIEDDPLLRAWRVGRQAWLYELRRPFVASVFYGGHVGEGRHFHYHPLGRF